jgi:integrase
MRCRVNGKVVPVLIGNAAVMPQLAEWRKRGRELAQLATQGIDPRRQKTEAAPTVKEVVGHYLGQHAIHRMRLDYYKETKRALTVDLKPIEDQPIDKIVRRDVRILLGGIVARGRAPHASHVLSYIRPMFRWAVDQEIIANNPAAGVPDPDPRKRQDRERDRYLDDAEIPAFWAACDQIGGLFGPLFQLLLLTAQRRDEVAGMTWPELDLEKRIWALPRERTKNDKAHVVHLSALALEIIKVVPRLSDKFVFSTTGGTPVSGWGRARRRLAAAMGDPEPFTLHDLRRSAATGMARIGIAHHVVDRILNHSAGKISGVARVYNQFDYAAERHAGLEAWSRHIESVLLPRPSNVFEIATAR